MVICAICHKSLKNNRSLVNHFKIVHKEVSSKQYYDLYIKKGKTSCTVCDKEAIFISLNQGYGEYCSSFCGTQSTERRDRIRETCQKKFGGNAPTCNPGVIALRKKNNQKKYGVDNVFQLESIKEKSKVTCLEKYGVEYPTQSEKQQEKTRNTCMQKYGVSSPAKAPEVKAKIIETSLEKYGAPHHLFTKASQNKRKETLFEHYGVTNPNYSPEIQRTKRAVIRGQHRENLYKHFVEELIEPNFTVEQFLDSSTLIFNFTCKVCSKPFIFDCMQQGSLCLVDCPNCIRKTHSRSRYEDDVVLVLQEMGFTNIEKNRRFNLKEIDVYLPDLKFGIDFHGIYWHSTEFTPPKYHQNKWRHFRALGIEYIQIFESEWILKRELVLSILKSKLQKNIPIHARKCIIREVSVAESRDFLRENHLQGFIGAKYKLGLFFEGQLIQLATFSKSRFDRSVAYELVRNCTKIGYRVVGGLPKLLKHFRKSHPGSIVSYCDVRYFNGISYLKSGFREVRVTEPNYFYWKNNNLNYLLESRQKYQKHKLKDILEKFDSKLTEAENMRENDYFCIYDAGNLKLILD